MIKPSHTYIVYVQIMIVDRVLFENILHSCDKADTDE